MRWGKKKQPKPLIAGRDRSVPRTPAQPVFSYHSYRAKPSLYERETIRTDAPRKRLAYAYNKIPWVASWRQGVVYWVCLMVIVLCAAKVLIVVPQSRIVVTDNQADVDLPQAEYAQYANRALRSNLLNTMKPTLNTNGIARNMEQKYPELSSVVVEVPLIGNRPVVYVAAEKPVFVLETTSQRYTISSSGYVLSELTMSAPSTLVRLKESSNRQPKPGSRYFAGSTVTFAGTLAYELTKAQYKVEYLELPTNAPYEIDVRLSGKPYLIRFNLQADVMQQSGGAIATLRQLGANEPKQYLDMRVLGRAYYK